MPSATSHSSATISPGTVENSLAQILGLIDEMGFESFDHLATTYYTASFSEGSLPRYAQSASRSRRLRGLLTDLYTSSKDWVGREAHGYYEGQFQLLETVCVEELGGICVKPQHCLEPPDQCDEQPQQRPKRIRRTQAFITNMIKQLFTDDGAEQLLKQDRQLLKEQVHNSCSFVVSWIVWGVLTEPLYRSHRSGLCSLKWPKRRILAQKIPL
ncbi:uncharacterized protein N7529_005566 [Penicillium soppii]|uniref:uncharacterized protein n=1 Tax=Penicillium soppii TaxID=69789 RepID=UPI00254820E2|nr:uncharacterized protein N7529_005566 [Penicillium soppii]KAJ5863650.1 hypothetical protein N7529_005566 [Penicillium soppii]